MMPMNTDPRLREWYEDEAAKVGYTDGFVMAPVGPMRMDCAVTSPSTTPSTNRRRLPAGS